MAVFGTGKVAVGTTATPIVTIGATPCTVYLNNHSNQQVWVGNSSSVTSANGAILPPHEPVLMPVTGACTIYAVSHSTGAELHYITGA